MGGRCLVSKHHGANHVRGHLRSMFWAEEEIPKPKNKQKLATDDKCNLDNQFWLFETNDVCFHDVGTSDKIVGEILNLA